MAITVAMLPELVGKQLAPSEWISIAQTRIDAFAACTDDHQFIHVDPLRAARETPFGGSIAHGFLLLSLIAAHPPADLPWPADMQLALNYGLDSVRFLAPVRAGARVRILTRVLEMREKEPGRWLLRQEKTVEIEGESTPALVAEALALLIAAAPAAQ
jgi:acyl dehydratase